MAAQDMVGEFQSPGGFVFGIQGWTWGDQRPTTITFFLDGTARVCDQHGRPIKGTVTDGKVVHFDKCNHAEVIAALAQERVDWQKLSHAGWPQIPYAELKKVKNLPPTPVSELQKIRDIVLRKDALKMRRELDEIRAKELQVVEEES